MSRLFPVGVLFLMAAVVRADPASDAGLDAAKLAEIPKAMQGFVDKGQAAGVVTLVARHGKVVVIDAVGSADVEAKRPMAKDTLFWIASMTKPVTATAFQILVDEGKVSADDEVQKYIPEFGSVKHKDGTSPAKPLTIKHLLTHTSGLGTPAPLEQRLTLSLADWSVLIAKQPLVFEPASKWQYGGGTNISIVGRIIEIVSGKPYAAFLSERIFGPLGMKDTGFAPSAEQIKRLAKIYKPGKTAGSLEPVLGGFVPDDGKPRTPNPSGGLFSSAADLATFYAMVLNGGELNGKRIVSKKAVERMTGVHTGDLKAGFNPGSGWGLGWGVVTEPTGVTKALSAGAFGHGGAFGTQGWVDPKTGLVYVLLVQRSGFGSADGASIAGTFYDAVGAAIRPSK